jgi:peroxiredoxin Q/BCP
MSLEPGASIPTLTLAASGGRTVTLNTDFAGRKLVIYFYPKDNTPGCTQEGQDFARLYPQFSAAGIEVLGASKDSVKSHDNFIAKYDFPFALLSDSDEKLCQAFGAIVEKSMYGRQYLGIDRSTYLFDANGVLRQVWRKVKVKGHAEAVLAAAQAI